MPSRAERLAALRAAGLERTLRHVEGAPGPEVVVDGRRLLLLCSNNYLGLAADPRVVRAAGAALERYGAGAGASRLVAGGTRLHRELEERLAAAEGMEDCLLYSSGYLANIGVLQALGGSDGLIASDRLNHASIIDGCRLSRARVAIFDHADARAAAAALAGPERDRLLVTDTVFSMDGDRAPLQALRAVCDTARALLVVDDAHATGVGGRRERADVVVGTLSKALGSSGGFACADADTVALLRSTSRSFIFDTAPAAAAVAAALEALAIVGREPERSARVADLALRLRAGLRAEGFTVLGDERCPIVPVLVGGVDATLALAAALLERGVLCPAIRPPTVPEGQGRLRATVMATHSEEQVDRAVAAFAAARAGVAAAQR